MRLETCAVNWSGGARELADLKVLLDVVSEVELADREELFYDSGLRLSALKDSTIQFRAESTYDTPDSDALDLLNDLRFGLSKLAVTEALAAAGITMVDRPGPTQNLGFTSNNRRISSHGFEVVFRAVFGLETGESTGLLEHVELSGELQTPDESDLIEVAFEVDDPTPEP